MEAEYFNIIDKRISFYYDNLEVLPPEKKSKFTFRHLKNFKGIQEFHREFVYAPTNKVANGVVVVKVMCYINTWQHLDL